MGKKKAFEPGDGVRTFTGEVGLVLSRADFTQITAACKEGKRPGHYFAPGCCHNPDYIIQVPVIFADGTYDVMRAMNLKQAPDLPAAQRSALEALLAEKP
jgi:hypothetical protein